MDKIIRNSDNGIRPPKGLSQFVSSIPAGLSFLFAAVLLVEELLLGGTKVVIWAKPGESAAAAAIRVGHVERATVIFIALAALACGFISTVNDRERMAWRRLLEKRGEVAMSTCETGNRTLMREWLVFLSLVLLLPIHFLGSTSVSASAISVLAVVTLFIRLSKPGNFVGPFFPFFTLATLCHFLMWSLVSEYHL